MVAGKPAFLYDLWGKQNYQELFVYRSDLGQNSCHFLPYFDYNSAVFLIILQDKLRSFDIQDDRSKRFPAFHNNSKSNSNFHSKLN